MRVTGEEVNNEQSTSDDGNEDESECDNEGEIGYEIENEGERVDYSDRVTGDGSDG